MARFQQISFRCQVRIALAMVPPTSLFLAFLLVLLQLGLGRWNAREESLLMLVLVCLILAIVASTVLALIQIAGLALFRRLGWKGPALEIDHPHLAGIFG